MPLNDPSSSLEDTGLRPCYVPIHKFPFPEKSDDDVEPKVDDTSRPEVVNPSPFSEVPDDIIREIFVRTLPTSHNAVLSPNQPPLLLTRICRLWRTVAFNTPALWASIHLPAPVLTFDASEDDGDLILDTILPGIERTAREWLARSGDLPLSISLRINADDRHSAIHSDTSETLINTFIHLSYRWKHLSIESVEDQCMGKILQVPAADVPSLGSLEVDGGFSMGCSPESKIYTNATLLQAPNLRSLSLHLPEGNVADLPVNWSQLASLSIRAATEISLENLAFLFRSCTNLQQFFVRLAFPSNGKIHGTEASRITCSHLQELSIVDTDNDRINLYKRLDLPNLRRLDYFRYPEKPCGLASLLPGTMGSIRHLITNPCVTPFPDFIDWLEHCPRLEALSLVPGPFELFANDVTSLPNTLLERLSKQSDDTNYGEDRGHLCPDLRRFECLVTSDFSAQEVLQFIKTKQAQADPRFAKLTDIIVAFDYIQDDAAEVEAELEALRKDGLHAALVYKLKTDKAYVRKLFVPIGGLSDKYTEGFEMGVFGGDLRL